MLVAYGGLEVGGVGEVGKVVRVDAIRFFFFQAEDGIRDYKVTGVQTCALPILLNRDINTMLDRLELLMDGIRHVSNTIAHNLRTPLTRILLRLRNAQQATPEEKNETLALVAQEVAELGVVFDKLLQIAEVESGASRKNFAPVDLRALLVDVVEFYEPLVEDAGGVILALWGALAEFMQRNQLDAMVGCASIPMQYPGLAHGEGPAHVWQQLRQTHQIGRAHV